MNEASKFVRSLERHPGTPWASLFTLLGGIAGLQREPTLESMLWGAGIMGTLWIPVLLTAWQLRNEK